MKDRIRKKIAKNKRREVLEILDLAMRKNEGKADVFFSFSGHVNNVDIRIFKNGWRYGHQETEKLDMSCYTDRKYAGDPDFSDMKRALEEL